MSDCRTIDRLATPYVDGELSDAQGREIAEHLSRCPVCHARVDAERSVRRLLQTRKAHLNSPCAPAALKVRCAAACRFDAVASRGTRAWRERIGLRAWNGRLAPLAAAAALILVVGGAFLNVATGRSERLLAAELTADHLKCFALNAVLRTRHSPEAVQSAMAAGFDWPLSLPRDLRQQGLDLVGSRPCLYGEGKTAHIMFTHNGRPVSLFMLPRVERPEAMLGVLGHECAIWSIGDRTFVLVAREARDEVARLAAFVRDSVE